VLISVIIILSTENNKPLLELLHEMQKYSHLITDWSVHGEFAYQYLKLNIAGDHCGDADLDGREIERNLTDFLKAFVRFKPKTCEES